MKYTIYHKLNKDAKKLRVEDFSSILGDVSGDRDIRLSFSLSDPVISCTDFGDVGDLLSRKILAPSIVSLCVL